MKADILKIENKMNSITLNLSILGSLVNVLIKNNNNLSNIDQSNIISLLDEKIKETKINQEELSLLFEL